MISADLAAFLNGRVDVHMGTRDDALQPHSCRVLALRVEEGQPQVVAFVPEVGADAVLHDLERNRQAAMVVSSPPDSRTYQLKGTFVDVARAQAEDRPYIEQFWSGFLASLEDIGIERRTFSHWPLWPALAIRIRVTAVFSQTPGPGAGAPMV